MGKAEKITITEKEKAKKKKIRADKYCYVPPKTGNYFSQTTLSQIIISQKNPINLLQEDLVMH